MVQEGTSKEKSTVALPDKKYFKIGETSNLLGVKPHVLRYWETEFPQVRPYKSKTGQRLYRRRDVEALIKIQKLLYEERFTIAGARQVLRLNNWRAGGHEEPKKDILTAVEEVVVKENEERAASYEATVLNENPTHEIQAAEMPEDESPPAQEEPTSTEAPKEEEKEESAAEVEEEAPAVLEEDIMKAAGEAEPPQEVPPPVKPVVDEFVPTKEGPAPTVVPKIEEKAEPKTEVEKPVPATPEVPKVEQPKAEPAAPEAPKVEQPKAEPAAPEAPKVEQPKAQPAAPEAPKVEQPKAQPAAPEAPKVEQPKAQPAAPEAPKVEQPKAQPAVPKEGAVKAAATESVHQVLVEEEVAAPVTRTIVEMAFAKEVVEAVQQGAAVTEPVQEVSEPEDMVSSTVSNTPGAASNIAESAHVLKAEIGSPQVQQTQTISPVQAVQETVENRVDVVAACAAQATEAASSPAPVAAIPALKEPEIQAVEQESEPKELIDPNMSRMLSLPLMTLKKELEEVMKLLNQIE